MDKSYYLQYYDYEREHWWFKARNKIIVSVLRKHVSSDKLKILNIGAATGYTSQLLEQFGEVISIEYDKVTCDLTKEKLNIDIRHGSVLDLQFEDLSFDVVCAFDVIEHIKEDEKAIMEMYRVCKTKGLLFITVPVYNFLWSEHDDINHHIKRYTRKMLQKSIYKQELSNIYTSYFNHFLFTPIAFVRLFQSMLRKKRTGNKLKSDFERFNKHSFFNKILYSIFIAEKPFINTGIPLPFGVSLMTIAKKS